MDVLTNAFDYSRSSKQVNIRNTQICKQAHLKLQNQKQYFILSASL